MDQDELEAEVRGRSILVKGGAGFIGSHLIDALVEQNEVRILDDLSSGRKANIHEEATLLEGDIRNRETVNRAMEDINVVFHEAALVSVEKSVSDPVTSDEINVSATLNILEAARRENARVVTASSAAIYGHPESVPILSPSQRLQPHRMEFKN